MHLPKTRILILDACRNNPLRSTKAVGGGPAPMQGRGSLIVFATEAGRMASDRGEQNGLWNSFKPRFGG